jgi:hypothetical protein
MIVAYMSQKEELKTEVFWDVTPRRLVTSNCTRDIYLSTWRHMVEKSDLHQNRSDNHKYRRKTVPDIFKLSPLSHL